MAGASGVPGIEALLLDFGNVVVPIDFGRVFEHWARTDGVAPEAVTARWAWDERYRAYERGEIDEAAYFAHLRERLGLRQGNADMLAGWNAVFLEPDPAMGGFLQELSRRHPLYLFSNTNRAHQAYWTIRYAGMLAPFTALYSSCEVGARKPEAEAFRRVAERMGVEPARIAFSSTVKASELKKIIVPISTQPAISRCSRKVESSRTIASPCPGTTHST